MFCEFHVVVLVVMYITRKVGEGLIQEGSYNENENRDRLFQEFIQKYNKVYRNTEEREKRFAIFNGNIDEIKVLQANEQGTAVYGVTRFSDLTTEEFIHLLGYRGSRFPSENQTLAEIPDVELPEHFDWRTHNVVTPVKDQKHCGSCWAFSTVGNIESQWAIKSGQLISLSVQELVDCDVKDNGCDGGDTLPALQEIIQLGGLESDEDYPYIGKEGQCRFNETNVKVAIKNICFLPDSEDAMAKWILVNGPASTDLNAKALKHYKSGVIHPSRNDCVATDLNHAVVIVGFGVEKTKHSLIPYWIVKNSWGKQWGEKGYFRMFRGDGTCGINLSAISAFL